MIVHVDGRGINGEHTPAGGRVIVPLSGQPLTAVRCRLRLAIATGEAEITAVEIHVRGG